MMRRKLRREVVGFCVLNCPVVVVVVGPVSFSDGGGSEMVRWSFGWVIFNIHIYTYLSQSFLGILQCPLEGRE